MPPAVEAKQSDTDATRSPECVEKVWDEQVDGAWAPGKAPVSLLTTFLKCVQERDSAEAEHAAMKILESEPNNRLVKDLLEAMKQQDALEAEENGFEEEEKEDDDEEEEEGSADDDEDDSDEASEEEDEEEKGEAKMHDADAKNND